MRVFAISDIHIDYQENYKWLTNLSKYDYQDDIIIMAGDLTDVASLFVAGLEILKKRFLEVLFIPGNHDLWVHRNNGKDSFTQFLNIQKICEQIGIGTGPVHFGELSIIPLYGWYDYSFGEPSQQILNAWTDYTACKWPDHLDEKSITKKFVSMNNSFLDIKNRYILSYSHFLPRIDLMPSAIPPDKRILYPVLGSALLEQQIRVLNSDIHIYGHSHVNMKVRKDDTMYINNAFGYPSETLITAKELICIFEL